jgi:antitoxin (DNA-binding transcriptional repressor) of toxin-antitoxin stability system
MKKFLTLDSQVYDDVVDRHAIRHADCGLRLIKMASIQLSELALLAESLRRGETVEIVDGDETIATIAPRPSGDLPARKKTNVPEWFLTELPPQLRENVLRNEHESVELLDELERQGKVTRGRTPVPDWFFTAPREECGDSSILDQLLADRRKNDW